MRPRWLINLVIVQLLLGGCALDVVETPSLDATADASASPGVDRSSPGSGRSPSLTPTSAPATAEADAGWLAFIRSGQVDIVRPDGSELRTLATDEENANDQFWSPDGERLAVADSEGPLLIIDPASGTIDRHSTPGGEVYGWLPDGSTLLFQSDFRTLSTLDVATGAIEELIAVDNDVWGIASPDGSRVAVTINDGTPIIDIALADVIDRSPYRVTGHPNGWIDALTWSPDGMSLAFCWHFDPGGSNPDARGGLYVAQVADWSVHRIVRGGACSDPAWSPDGRWIASLAARNGRPQVRIVGPDGSDARWLTQGRWEYQDVSWSPESDAVAYLRARSFYESDRPRELRVLRLAEADDRLLVRDTGLRDLSWQPMPP